MSLPEFEAILKEVVNSKRLSASKMVRLTDLTMKNMEHDTQLVSILYRTHKSLPTSTAKVSSLYVFDALSRAAKQNATKHGLTGDAFTHPGNSASFLFKVGGVVEGLFQDMVTHGSAETKEKTKKILDIWVKGSTFPPDVLTQLARILKEAQKVSITEKPVLPPTPPVITPHPQHPQPSLPTLPVQLPPNDPRTSGPGGYTTFPNPAAASPPAQIVDPQAALLALLAQAAASNGKMAMSSSSNINHPIGVPQLAVLQQLAHTAVSVPSVPQFLPPTDRVNIQNIPSSSGINGSAHSPPSYRNEPRIMGKSEQRYSGYRSPESEARPDTRFDDRDNMRGRHRGGFRARGRGDRGLGRSWDQRDRDYYRNSERDQSPLRDGRGGRSRSRSPSSRYKDTKVSRFSSPARRPTAALPPAWTPSLGERPQPQITQPEPGKDEFGRDIRPESPKSPVTSQELPITPEPTKSPVNTSHPPKDPRPPLAATTSTNHEPIPPVSSFVPSNISSTKVAAPVSDVANRQNGMESFNLATFDYTSPASWEALGKMWQVSNGYPPSTEELMAFIMAGGNVQAAGASGPTNQEAQKPIPTGPSRGGYGRGRGAFGTGRGGTAFGHAHGRQHEGPWANRDYSSATDAVVLGVTSDSDIKRQHPMVNPDQTTEALGDGSRSPHGGGRMQKVAGKWVFVQGTNMDVS